MKDATNRADRRRAHRIRSEITAKRTRFSLKLTMILFTLIVTIACTILPCFATAAGGAGQEYQKDQMSWNSITITNADGDNKTVLDYSLTSLTDTDGDGQVEQTESVTAIDTDFSRVARIVWNGNPTYIGLHFKWTTSTTFTRGTNPSTLYDTIEVMYDGIYYVSNGSYYKAYDYNTRTWSADIDRGIVFEDAAIVKKDFASQVTALDHDGGETGAMYFKHNANFIAYVINGTSLSTWDAFKKEIKQTVITNRNTETGQAYTMYETVIPTWWQANTNETTLAITAHDFIVYPTLNTPIVAIDNPNNTLSNLLQITYNRHDEIVLSYKMWYTWMGKDVQETHTENEWLSWYAEDYYTDYETTEFADKRQITINPVPYNDIIGWYQGGWTLGEGIPIIVERLTVYITYRHYRADGVPSWYISEPLIINMMSDDDITLTGVVDYIKSRTGNPFNTYPTPTGGNAFEFIDIIAAPLDGFLNIPIFGFFTLGNLIGTCIAIGAVFVLLKIFAGG